MSKSLKIISGGCLERGPLSRAKQVEQLSSQTLSGGFSPTRERCFHFFTLTPKSHKNGGQKLSKWRPNALKNLSGEGLNTLFKKQGHTLAPKWTKNQSFFEHFFEILSREVFESIGPPFWELLATIFDTFWDQWGKVNTALSLQSEPSREGLRG